jgi:hypothetical protein
MQRLAESANCAGIEAEIASNFISRCMVNEATSQGIVLNRVPEAVQGEQRFCGDFDTSKAPSNL